MTTRALSEIADPRRVVVAHDVVPRDTSIRRPPPSDWDRYVQAILEHRRLVLALTLCGTLLGVLAARRVEPQFAARATLWIESGDPDAVVGRMASGRLLDATSWMELLTTSTVLDSVVRSLRLYLAPSTAQDAAVLGDFDIAPDARGGSYEYVVERDGAGYVLSEDGTVIERGATGDSVGRTVGFRWLPGPEGSAPGTRAVFGVQAPVEATSGLARGLRGTVDAGASFLRLELRGSDPARTTATLNAITERGVAVAAALKRQRLEELDRILGGQYEHAEQELRSAERTLVDFRVRSLRRLEASHASGAQVTDADLTGVAELGAERDQLRRDRRRLETLLASAAGGPIPLEALGAVASAAASAPLRGAIDEASRREAELRALRYRYSDASAPVVEAQAALSKLLAEAIPALARTLAAELAARERAIAPRVDAAFGRLREAPPLAIEETRLVRRVESAEAIVGTVGERMEANRLALHSSLPDLHVLDPARRPRTPASDLGPLLIALAFVTSFGASVFGVRLRDRLDSRIRRPEQVTDALQLPILACLPRVGWQRIGRGPAAGEEVIESLRALRVRLLQSRGVGALCVTVSSPSSGDGKSFLSANLALSFAHAGFRTLLIDGDVRRGVQHRVLGVAPRPGIVEVLGSGAPLAESIQRSEHPGLDVLSAGMRSPRAPELIIGPALTQTLATLRSRYDVIIVDSPPLAAGVDALVLAEATENLVLVLRSGMTDLPLALAKLDAAGAHHVHLVGAVLNDVRGQGAFRYYGYDLAGYGDGEEIEAEGRFTQRVLGGRP